MELFSLFQVMRLRLLQTIIRKQPISTDSVRFDYEESEDDSLTSPLTFSINHRSSSSSLQTHLYH